MPSHPGFFVKFKKDKKNKQSKHLTIMNVIGKSLLSCLYIFPKHFRGCEDMRSAYCCVKHILQFIFTHA